MENKSPESKKAITVRISKYFAPKVPALQFSGNTDDVPEKLIAGVKGKDLVLEFQGKKTVYSNSDLEKKAGEIAGDSGNKETTKFLLMQTLVASASIGQVAELNDPQLLELHSLRIKTSNIGRGGR